MKTEEEMTTNNPGAPVASAGMYIPKDPIPDYSLKQMA